ncbi:helix-turn-helix domain-containing protein [Yinghuangia aomiensis]|uniref:helix-turn-helix domain-containing protein n=1 Tax=Yinghuangia aomiensis TaxID=676205 RepID=UPI0031E74D08
MDAVEAVATVREFMDLLLREAGAADFDAPVADAREAGLGPALLEEIEATRAAALRLRDVLLERRRREAESAALNETAGDLAALRDVDAVLRAIVHRARSLLGSDTAYLSLHDAIAGDTYLRVTSGSVSPRFQRLRMAVGEGIGGLVAVRGVPFVTADYFADDSFRHTPSLDAGVRDEGLVAMLAVPLVVGDTVIGVLWASDRRARRFGPAEVALLASLAAHAAVALDNARLLAETRAAVADLAAANARERAHTASVERAAAAHDRLTELVLAGAGVDEVVAAVDELVDGDVSLLLHEMPHDPHLRPDAAESPRGDEPTEDDGDFARAHREALTTGRATRAGSVEVAPVAAGTERLGVLVRRGSSRDADLALSDTRILERAAMIVSLLLLFRRSIAETEHRLADELVRELLGDSPRTDEALAERAARLGADLARPHVAVVVDAPSADRNRLASAAAHLAATAEGLAGEVDARTVLLLPGSNPSAAARRAATDIGAALGHPATAGAAGPALGRKSLAAAHAEAAGCATALAALGRRGEGAAMGELGFLGVLLADAKDISGFVRRTLGPLLDYDRVRGSELTRTASAYFDTGRSLTKTRDTLHVHINTVTQRLDRIASLLGADWREPHRELQIRLALHLRSLLPA